MHRSCPISFKVVHMLLISSLASLALEVLPGLGAHHGCLRRAAGPMSYSCSRVYTQGEQHIKQAQDDHMWSHDNITVMCHDPRHRMLTICRWTKPFRRLQSKTIPACARSGAKIDFGAPRQGHFQNPRCVNPPFQVGKGVFRANQHQNIA